MISLDFFENKFDLLRDEILHHRSRTIHNERSYFDQYLPQKHVVSE